MDEHPTDTARLVAPQVEESASEAKPDVLSNLAVDANELMRAIWSGQGTDLSRLVQDLLRDRPAA